VIPETVEHIRDTVHDAANTSDIKITKFRIFPRTEVLIGDVATTDDRYLIIDCERLGMHAAVNTSQVCQSAPGTSPSATMKRVEDPDFEIGM